MLPCFGPYNEAVFPWKRGKKQQAGFHEVEVPERRVACERLKRHVPYPEPSVALLGLFDPLAEVAATSLRFLDKGDLSGFRRTLTPTVPFAPHQFQKPTFFYKTGVVSLAYLNGHQKHFRMVGRAEGFRSIVHLAELFRLADKIGLFRNPELAVKRMANVLALAGLKQ